jgi:hypothetical protein
MLSCIGNRITLALKPARRFAIIGVAVLACAVYMWQVASGLANEDTVDQRAGGVPIKSLVVVRESQALQFKGKGIAVGASGTLSFDSHGGLALLQVLDMPVLPANQVYEMWVIDETGQVHASSIFRVPVEGQEDTTIPVSTAYIVGTYVRFFVTIEPASGNLVPTGPVVMDN